MSVLLHTVMFNYITFPTSMDYYSSDIDNKRFQLFTVYRLQSNTKCENKAEHNFKQSVSDGTSAQYTAIQLDVLKKICKSKAKAPTAN